MPIQNQAVYDRLGVGIAVPTPAVLYYWILSIWEKIKGLLILNSWNVSNQNSCQPHVVEIKFSYSLFRGVRTVFHRGGGALSISRCAIRDVDL